ncbi:MAG: redoxin family protein [Terriglobales bacterium]
MPFAAIGLALCFFLPAPHTAPQRAAAPTDTAAASPTLGSLLDIGEPGRQLRGLERYLHQHPNPPEAVQIYQQLIQDATALNDSRRVLAYNEELQALEPDDLGQRITVLNQLLLESSAKAMALAAQDAHELALLVAVQAASPPPQEATRAQWKVDMNRLRAIAQMFLGAVAQKTGHDVAAATDFRASLALEPTEEAAEHLGQVLEARGQATAAVRAYALALALPGQTIAERSTLRGRAGALYARLHQGSQRGFGDLILDRFDQIAQANARQQQALHPYAARNHEAQSVGQFVLTSLDGVAHRLASERGKVVVLDFWATWCGPCQAEHPAYEALKRHYGGQSGVAFILINTDDEHAKVGPFLAAHHWADDTWLDAGLADYLGIDSLPTTVVLAPNGQMVYRESGFDEASYARDLRRAIRYARTRVGPSAAKAGRRAAGR